MRQQATELQLGLGVLGHDFNGTPQRLERRATIAPAQRDSGGEPMGACITGEFDGQRTRLAVRIVDGAASKQCFNGAYARPDVGMVALSRHPRILAARDSGQRSCSYRT
jgi:hypothetical protein